MLMWLLSQFYLVAPEVFKPIRLRAISSETRKPWRYAIRIMVPSRCWCLPTFRAASIRDSTSWGDRCSLGLLTELAIRFGGTFPFTGVGAPAFWGWKSSICADIGFSTFPFMDILGKDYASITMGSMTL